MKKLLFLLALLPIMLLAQIPEEEQIKYPDPNNPGEFYKHKMDMKNPYKFDKLCFMDAAEELGMFDPNFIKNED